MPSLFLWQESERESLSKRYEQPRCTSQAMWRLLKLKLDLNDEELRQALIGIEQEMQGQVHAPKSQLLNCSTCRHPIQSTAKCCLYCGAVHLVNRPSTNLASKKASKT